MARDDELRGRVPPHNEEAERAVLGALMCAPDRIPEVCELLEPEDFYAKRNGLLFACLRDLANRSDAAIDFLTIGEALKATDRYHAVGGHEYILELAQTVTSAAHVAHHAQIVAETAMLRQLIQQATSLIEEAYSVRPDAEAVRTLLDESERKIFEIARKGERQAADPILRVLEETFKKIDARTQHELTGLPTGFLELDDKLCGLNQGDLIIVAARPSMGKTAFALNMIESVGLSHPACLGARAPVVLLFSLEMGKQSIVNRMLCSRARVDAHKLRTGRIPDEEYAALAEAAGELARTQVFIDDTPGLSVMALRGRARRLKAQRGLDLVVLDYLQLMSHPKSESRQMEISAISRSLKALARELEIPVVALAQLSRAVEQRDPPRPMLSDLRESGSIEQDADIVMMLYRAEYYARGDVAPEDKGKAEVIIAKHRNGPTGEVRLQFFPNIMRFDNPAPTAAEQIYA
jgi:replicative DNA helicase